MPLYGSNYILKPVKPEIFKLYIETDLANSFIKLSKLQGGALIFFIPKFNHNLYLSINY